MKIIGLVFEKISIEKKNAIKEKTEIKSGLSITDIKKEENNLSDKDALRFDFSYEVDYSPEIAKVELKGSIITIDDKGESKEIFKSWKEKKVEDKIRIPLFNFIMEKCNVKALALEDDLGMPFHMPMPRIGVRAQTQDNKDEKNKNNKEKNPANYAG
ncbi:hypothetical protein FJZ17_00305 [Candidatus Pacearchaeota archaeon]|nr:hypothetical protein [Candidatus Pacearchaeota archaeon]